MSIKRQQSKNYEEHANTHKEKAVVQVDFAENYTCRCQDEVQTAHWGWWIGSQQESSGSVHYSDLDRFV